jgi:hypothetical protein
MIVNEPDDGFRPVAPQKGFHKQHHGGWAHPKAGIPFLTKSAPSWGAVIRAVITARL